PAALLRAHPPSVPPGRRDPRDRAGQPGKRRDPARRRSPRGLRAVGRRRRARAAAGGVRLGGERPRAAPALRRSSLGADRQRKDRAVAIRRRGVTGRSIRGPAVAAALALVLAAPPVAAGAVPG